MNNSYSQETKDRAIQMYIDGEKVAKIAKKLRLSGPSIVYTFLRKKGGAQSLGQARRAKTQELRATAVKLYEKGHSFNQIAFKLSKSQYAIRMWCRQAGIPSRSVGCPPTERARLSKMFFANL